MTTGQRALPKTLQCYEDNSAADGFYDVKDLPCTRSLKNFMGSDVGSQVIETFVRTLGAEKADRVEKTFQGRKKRKKKRSYGMQYVDLLEKERLKGSEYHGSFCTKEPPRLFSLRMASQRGKELVDELKESGDTRRLDKLVDVCRGVTWVKHMYDDTLSSEAHAKYRPIDLSTVDRRTVPRADESNVPIGTIKALRDRARSTISTSFSTPCLSQVGAEISLPMPSRPKHDGGERMKENFACGFGSNKWKSESRSAWQGSGRPRPFGGSRSRGFCGVVNYAATLPAGFALWNGDVFPTNIKNPNHRTFP